jgi:hypothetical protein
MAILSFIFLFIKQKVTHAIYVPPVNIKSETLNTFFVLKKKRLLVEIYIYIMIEFTHLE